MAQSSLFRAEPRAGRGNSGKSDRHIQHTVQPTELPDTTAIAFDKTELLNDGRDEPRFATATTIVAHLAETVRLDPTRVDLIPEIAPPKHGVWRGSIGSLLLHLLPLLALIGWLRPSLDISKPIPVQLVIEQPPPPPPAKPAPQPSPETSELHASDNFGKVGPPSDQKGAETKPPTQGEPSPPAAEAQTAPTPPVPPIEAPQAASANAPPPPAKPAPPQPQMVVNLPKPPGLELALPQQLDQPSQAAASARFPGPNATRDEYFAYALSLTTQHMDLLPLSLLGARQADTTVIIRVRQDGTILDTRVMQGSGYLDIDEKVIEMVKAVGKYPPFPLWMHGPTADFTLHMHFPNKLQRQMAP